MGKKWVALLYALYRIHERGFISKYEMQTDPTMAPFIRKAYPTFDAFRCAVDHLRRHGMVYRVKPIFPRNPHKYIINLRGLQTLRKKGYISEPREDYCRLTVLGHARRTMPEGEFNRIANAVWRSGRAIC